MKKIEKNKNEFNSITLFWETLVRNVLYTIKYARVIENILCIWHYWATSLLDRSNGEHPDIHKMFTERSGTLSYMELWQAPSGLFGNVFRSKGRQLGWYDHMKRADGAGTFLGHCASTSILVHA